MKRKFCQSCGGVIPRKEGQCEAKYKLRITCSRSCNGRMPRDFENPKKKKKIQEEKKLHPVIDMFLYGAKYVYRTQSV